MPLQPNAHRIAYDSEGNITILPIAGTDAPWQETEMPTPVALEQCLKEEPLHVPETTPREAILVALRARLRSEFQETMEEGWRQVVVSVAGGGTLWKDLRHGCRTLSHACVFFLTQPVWIPGRNQRIVQTNRGTLFLLDTIRFGGTFAVIFALLFTVLNYQSFSEIVLSRLRPIRSLTAGLDQSFQSILSEKLRRVPELSEAGRRDRGTLLGLLPDVGPPENRLIIPKLNLNIPIVIPPYGALLREDWEQVELDIQEALEDGVVHYPGTARPGQAGNFFVTGHSSYYPWALGRFKTVFARLPQLDVGDEYWVYYGGDRHRYIVEEKKEVRPSDISVLDQPTDERIATLMTCTPVGTTLRRLVIVARELDPETGAPLEVGQHAVRTADALKLPAGELPI